VKIYDITREMLSAPVYPGDCAPQIVRQPDTVGGEEQISLMTGLHAGTHADAFSHFLPEGADIAGMPLELYCGPCKVLSVPGDTLIRVEDLRGRISGAERIALHSGGESYLCEAAAEYLASCGVRTLVTDSVSVGPKENEASIHRILLSAGTAVVENALLDGVPDGDYLLFAFPLKIQGADGAPLRAVLLCRDDAVAAPETLPDVFS